MPRYYERGEPNIPKTMLSAKNFRHFWKSHVLSTLVCSVPLLAGCGHHGKGVENQSAQVAEGVSEETINSVKSLTPTERLKGRRVFVQCQSCHNLKPGEPHGVGPNLNGMFGRVAGGASGYAFSPALRDSEIVWTAESLRSWLLAPSEVIPGNLMVFSGMEDNEDLDALIDYLGVETR